jgi:hypothetical protein
LFAKGALSVAPAAAADAQKMYAWLENDICAVRSRALGFERAAGQYARALAVHLYRASWKDPRAGTAENARRAGAYVLAERLLKMTWP